MLSRAKLAFLVKQYFLERELEEASPAELGDLREHFDIVLRDGNNLVGVRIVELHRGSISRLREKITAAIVKSLKEGKGRLDKVYIAAASDKLISLPSSEIFRESGVGLLLLDSDGRVVERIPARPLGRSLTASNTEDLLLSLKTIKAQLHVLEEKVRSLERLEARIVVLEREVSRLSKSIRPTEGGLSTGVEEAQPSLGPVDEGMPDFLKDNPWLDVLSKRRTG